ncbi:MAG: response regulator [Acidobacteria bacterium]|nr:response regulator [Acidobacteriota bacterium]
MSRIVLLVEDAESCSTTLEVALDRIPDLVVKSATTSEQALEMLHREPISALITDLHLPNMDGMELVERVRARPSGARIPILVISGDADPRTPERVLRAGADAFFAKPYSPAAVRQKLETLLNAV